MNKNLSRAVNETWVDISEPTIQLDPDLHATPRCLDQGLDDGDAGERYACTMTVAEVWSSAFLTASVKSTSAYTRGMSRLHVQ